MKPFRNLDKCFRIWVMETNLKVFSYSTNSMIT